jgi:hypothetical protein
MSATTTHLTVVPDARADRRTRNRAAGTATADRWLAVQVAIAVALGVLLAVGLTAVVIATQTLHMSI